MLTIQPISITHGAKPTAFRGDFDEEAYNSRKNYYAHQKEECDEILENQYVPNTMKKGVKVCKAISEGVLSGWAVAWAALKVAKFGKASALKISNNKFIKKAVATISPIKDGVVQTAKNIKNTVVEKLSSTKLGKAVKARVEKFEKMTDEDLAKYKLGKFALKHEEGITKIFDKAKNFATAIKDKASEVKKAVTYDKTAKVAAYTLGIGSGVASAYNTARQDFAQVNEEVDE